MHFSKTNLHFSDSWKTAAFKKYNFEADGIPTDGGAFHPLLKVREEIRNIFFEMGYEHLSPQCPRPSRLTF